MKKLRLLITEACNRKCEGCCNKGFDLKALPVCQDLNCWDEVYITGGEPMLRPELVRELSRDIAIDAMVYMYTAKVDNVHEAIDTLRELDGMTLTLHEQADVAHF